MARNLVPLTLVERLSPGAQQPERRAERARMRWPCAGIIDGSGPRKQNLGGAPDRDYLWLERLTSAPLDLTAGDHTLTFEYAGSDPTRGVSVDGFFLLPVPLTQTLSGPNGARLTLSAYDVEHGKLTLEEH